MKCDTIYISSFMPMIMLVGESIISNMTIAAILVRMPLTDTRQCLMLSRPLDVRSSTLSATGVTRVSLSGPHLFQTLGELPLTSPLMVTINGML